MSCKIFPRILSITFYCSFLATSYAQNNAENTYVDPFIGTDNAKSYTKWGKEGGTYPGAVAPWGYVQLSPETVGSGQAGYHYQDTVIHYFSCTGHHSGFPEGSVGNIKLMPFSKNGGTVRFFRHQQEKASPGYYGITFADDGTLLECTANTRVGVFRITFPAGVEPRLWISDVGALTFADTKTAYGTLHGSAFRFSADVAKQETSDGAYILHFPAKQASPTVLTITVSASPLGHTSALKNISALEDEIRGTHDQLFSYVYRQTSKNWAELMRTITVNDANNANKRNFYTALYHACLLPWVISDVDGFYKGADGLTHRTKSSVQYGGFSPWDTFRSLHPLIQLLWPQRQADMVQSMLDVYEQSGFLPTESMTGNHAVPILVDTYMKNTLDLPLDKKGIYEALKGSIYHPPFRQKDLSVYHEKGFVPATMGESVTRTMEYAYDDWALAHFAAHAMHDTLTANVAEKRSRSYRQLFNAEKLFFIPRDETGWRNRLGTFGYKEGDPYIYSYFVPQYPRDLINLMGNDTLFTSRLQDFLSNQQLVFDNEPAFHVPYLFNYAHRPDLTQFWVHHILDKRFMDTPGGLPGNDDLGSMSSWYIFNALGFYPMAPGRAVYTLGTPLFDQVIIHLANGKDLQVQKTASNETAYYVQDLQINGKATNTLEISHRTLMEGGKLKFIVGENAHSDWNMSAVSITDDTGRPAVRVRKIDVSKEAIKPNERAEIRVALENTGATSTKQLSIMVNGKEYAHKNVFLQHNEERTDTVNFTLYPYGEHQLSMEGHRWKMQVIPSRDTTGFKRTEVSQLTYTPVLQLGNNQTISYQAKNVDGAPLLMKIPIILNGQTIAIDSLTLGAGEEKKRTFTFKANQKGAGSLQLYDQHAVFNVYESPLDALLLGGKSWKPLEERTIVDESLFHNRATLHGKDVFSAREQLFILDSLRYISWDASPIVNAIHTRMTMMLWVKPSRSSENLVDILSKGDYHVLQIVEGKKLNFFAGGWGRGECSVDLPADWYGKWHHVAGVCDGKNLHLFLDGQLAASLTVEPDVSLSNDSRWQLGQNEEFPNERIYRGLAKEIMVFPESLSAEEIALMAGESRP